MTAEERMMWVERYSALPTGNVADAMDGLGLKRGSVLGLHPIDPSQKRAAGFARTILQKRRSTPWDGVNLAKHGKVIDDKTEPGDLLVISKAFALSTATVKNMKSNLGFAFVYNALGIPIAAGILYPFWGILLSPVIAAGAMCLSSVSVILNALRLRRFS